MGIPVIGCRCPVCNSESPCNQRLRPSGLITIDQKMFLIDCGPDFRTQALRHHIDHLDGVIVTHAHHDHIAGVDDLRILHMRSKTPIPFLLSEATAKDLKQRYYYFFEEDTQGKLTARLDLHVLEGHRGEVEFQGVRIRYISYSQVGMHVNGYRFGPFAYISDIRQYPDTIFEDLRGVKILVVSALRTTSSPMHFSVDEAVEFSKRVGAEQTWLTHIAHDLDHEQTNAHLPPNVRMAYDGLEINFEDS